MRSPLMVLLAVLAAPTAFAQRRVAPRPAPQPAADKVNARRLALVEQPAATGVAKAAVHTAARSAEQEFKALGYDLLPAAQLAAAFGKGAKVPACGDAAECLAGIGKLANVDYVLNVALNPAGKQFSLKLTLVDAADSKIVSNIMSFVARPQEPALTETVKKQVTRAAAALDKHIGEKEVLALAAKLEPKPRQVEPSRESAKPERPALAAAPAASQAPVALPAPAAPAATGEAPLLPPLDAGHTEVTVQATKGPGAFPFILMGAGATAIGIGLGFFGMDAKEAVDRFKAGNNPQAARDRAKKSALLCDITTGAGAAVMLTGLGLVLFSMDDPAKSVAIAPAGPGVAVSGRF